MTSIPTPLAAVPAGRVRAMDEAGLVTWASLGILVLLLAWPLGYAVWAVFADAESGLASLARAAENGSIGRVIWNTTWVVLGSTAVAVAIGSVFAWVNERTDAHLPGFGDLLPLAPLLVPPIAGVMGWAILLDPRVGLANIQIRRLLDLFGIEMRVGPFNIYTGWGLILVTALFLVPYVYLLVSAALRRLDPALEEASRVGGAGPMKTLVRITLPSVTPAIVAAALLSIVGALGLFSVPVVIGTAARIDVLSVYLFRLFESYPPQTALALVLAAGMVATVQALLIIQRLMTRGGRHATVGGRGFRGTRVRLGPFRHVVRAVALVYLAATALAPLIGLVIVSTQSFWTPIINWSRASLVNYRAVLFENAGTQGAFVNSLAQGAAVATVAMLLGALVVLRTRNGSPLAGRLADAVTTLPAVLPHTVVGIAFLLAFGPAPFRLYGTAAILFLAYLAMAMPYAGQAAIAAAGSIGRELGEASRVAGADAGRTFRRILLPVALPGLAAGWAMIFIHTAGEVSASALLAGTNNPVIGRVMMDLWAFGSYPQVAALAVLMAVVNGVMIAMVLRFGKRAAGGGAA